MSRFDISLACTVLAGLVVRAQEPPPEQEFTLYAATELVVLSVGVQDSHGANVRGLKASDFKIYEDGQIQTIKQFASEERPVTVGIVVDASGSMRKKQAEVITAALSFVKASNPQDEIFVVNFNDQASLGLPSNTPFSSDPGSLREALLGRYPAGRTALYDALTLAAKHLAEGKWERKALLLISDGGDNNSDQSFGDAVRAVEESGATLYNIGLFDPDEPEHNLGTLRRLSKMTGGETFVPMNLSEIGPLCLRVAADIRASYTLAYTPPQPEQHSKPRKLKVVATDPGAGKLMARTRTSYILAGK
jgi:Ca-activated chloride channel family protein